jgi:hypothetical protein
VGLLAADADCDRRAAAAAATPLFYVWYEEMPFPLCDCTQNCIPNAAQSNWQAELMLGFQLLPVQSPFFIICRSRLGF